MKEALQRAIKKLGSQEKLAAAIPDPKVKQQHVSWWLNKCNGRVPSDYCPDIELACKGDPTCEQLRPDVNWAVLRGTGNTEVEPGPSPDKTRRRPRRKAA